MLLMKVLISKKTGNVYYYKEKGELHTKEGFIKEEELMSGKSVVLTANSEAREFLIFDGNKYDLTKKFKRGPQMIQAKDLGYVLSRTRIDKHSKIVEAGGGMGAATSFFASLVKSVKCYEIRADHCEIIKSNLELMGVDNVELINADLNDTIQNEKDVDLLFLDMPNCEKILEKDLSGIKSGRYIVCYIPSITQILDLVAVVNNSNCLYLEEVSEIILRHWKVTDRIARPEHQKETDHTAFLVFLRKY